MNIHFLGASVNANGQRAIARAKSYKGPDKKESFGGYLIIYKSGTATIVPMESYSVAVAMPNPVPYRGVSIGVVAGVPITYSVTYAVTQVNSLNLSVSTLTIYINGSDGSRIVYSTQNGSLTADPAATAANPGSHYANSDTGWFLVYTLNNYSNGTVVANGFENGYWSGGIFEYYDGGINYTNIPITNIAAYQSAVAQAAAMTAASQAANPTKTYVMASDGQVLAGEVQNTTGGHTYYVPDTTWNGDAYCNMYVDSVTPPINHQLTFTVPEDCIYPIPATPPDVFKARRKAWLLKNSTEFIAALKGKFQPGAAGVTRAELQTGAIPASWQTYIKMNVHRSLKTYQPNPIQILSGPTYSLGASNMNTDGKGSWNVNFSGTITVGYLDDLGSMKQQTFTGDLNVIGTIHSSSDLQSQQPSVVQTYTNFPVIRDNGFGEVSEASPFVYDYAASTFWSQLGGWNPAGGGFRWNRAAVQDAHIRDHSYSVAHDNVSVTDSYFGLALFGTVTGSFTSSDYVPSSQVGSGRTSAYKVSPSIAVQMFGTARDSFTWANTTTPPFPPDGGTATLTNPQFILDWVKANPPKYHSETPSTTHDGNTAWNNSALYGVKSVSLRLFGPVASDGTQLGAFADPADADGCVSVSCYGTLAMAFDWKTGAFTFSSWSSKQILDANGKPILDALGNPTYPITALPKGISYKNASGTLKFTGLTDPYGIAKPDEVAYNVVISYNYVAAAQWPDVAAATAADKAAATATLAYATTGAKPPTTPAIPFGDPVRAFVLSL